MSEQVRFYKGSGIPSNMNSNNIYFTEEGQLWFNNNLIGLNNNPNNINITKGFYIKYIETVDGEHRIYLKAQREDPHPNSPDGSCGPYPYWPDGDLSNDDYWLSCRLQANYTRFAKLVFAGLDSNDRPYIIVSDLPFTQTDYDKIPLTDETLSADTCFIWCDQLSDQGPIELPTNLCITLGSGCQANMYYSFAGGANAKAIGKYGIAYGVNTVAGYGCAAFGSSSIATGLMSFAAGGAVQANKNYSVAFGNNTKANGVGSFALGVLTTALGTYSFAGGGGKPERPGDPADPVLSKGDYSFAFGYRAKALGNYSVAFGNMASASTVGSIAIGNNAQANTGDYAVAIGRNTIASHEGSVAIGDTTKAYGKQSCAINCNNTAGNTCSFASGINTQCYGLYSITGGEGCSVGSINAQGYRDSFAMGKDSQVNHNYGMAMGYICKVSHVASSAFGYETETGGNYQFVVGKHNVLEPNARFVVGNGSTKNSRSNALVVYADGNVSVNKKLTAAEIDATKLTCSRIIGGELADTNNTLFAIGIGYQEVIGGYGDILHYQNALAVYTGGAVVVGQDPQNDMEVANKRYVDNKAFNGVDEDDIKRMGFVTKSEITPVRSEYQLIYQSYQWTGESDFYYYNIVESLDINCYIYKESNVIFDHVHITCQDIETALRSASNVESIKLTDNITVKKGGSDGIYIICSMDDASNDYQNGIMSVTANPY